MKIAIHHHSGGFSDYWIDYCEKQNIRYKLVNAYQSDIINQLKDCDGFMWHHSHTRFKDIISAKKILFALQQAGVPVFPNFNTNWHFDDKVGQKYLLEAIEAPLVPSYIFYDKTEALNWAKNTSYPKVFKLKGGAGAKNVKLIQNRKEAYRLIRKAFSRGFPQFDKISNMQERLKNFKSGQDNFLGILKGLSRIVIEPKFSKLQNNERGYVYFQDFIPNNNSDIRVVVVGRKFAAAERRMVRSGDFRASGSGLFNYDNIDIRIIESAFNIADRLNLQSVAFDYIFDEQNMPLIIEMSFGFGTKGILSVPGYWDRDLKWYNDSFKPQEWIIENFLSYINQKK